GHLFRPWILPRQESFASLHILTRRASEGSEALPSLARRVRMSFFGARVIPSASKVGITPVKFQGVSNYLDDLPQKVALYLDDGRANFVFGLIVLYGIPVSRIDLRS